MGERSTRAANQNAGGTRATVTREPVESRGLDLPPIGTDWRKHLGPGSMHGRRYTYRVTGYGVAQARDPRGAPHGSRLVRWTRSDGLDGYSPIREWADLCAPAAVGVPLDSAATVNVRTAVGTLRSSQVIMPSEPRFGARRAPRKVGTSLTPTAAASLYGVDRRTVLRLAALDPECPPIPRSGRMLLPGVLVDRVLSGYVPRFRGAS